MQDNAPSTSLTQAELYAALKSEYSMGVNTSNDYIFVGETMGIEYYGPNDESWMDVIAVCEHSKLAVLTTFFEFDDMADDDSDYAFVIHDGQLVPQYETR